MIKLCVLKLASSKTHPTPKSRRTPYDPIGSFPCFLGCTLVGGLVGPGGEVDGVFCWFLNGQDRLNNTGSIGNLCDVSFS